ncbi:hypothetical protein CK203_098234 [Vitis vinifera]|uniref:Uncharacterized protein n=1 Tax=Vitis vinifera TaxID=29760 RepID=A0A438FIC7_VITVI|nr:hypothetical protein CK203_098234 [Vitis vinifera]
MGSVNQFLYQKMVLFAQSFWVSVSTYLLPLFSFIFRYFFRFQEDDKSETKNLNLNWNGSENPPQEIKQTDLNCADPDKEAETEDGEEAELDAVKLEDSEVEEETPKSFLSFKFQAYEEFAKTLGGNGDPVSPETMSTNKHEFMHGKEVSSFMEEPEAVSFTVKELYTNSNDGSSQENDFSQQNSEAEAVHGEVSEISPKLDQLSENELPHVSEKEVQFFLQRTFWPQILNFEELDNLIDIGGQQIDLRELMKGVLGTEDDDFHQELQRLEESELNGSDALASGMLSEEDFHGERVNPEEEEHGGQAGGNKNNLDETEDSNRLETLWEHQELIEQLKMELRKVRATGLPTILEESESPKMMEDLKPWKIDDKKFQHEERMDELHKIYKLYSERMRKFDILNYQKMYAIGFLQSKDPLQSISGQKSSVPAFTSLLSQNFRRKKSETDPMVKFIKELHSDLEMVYVGQLCLSWEFLHWQYERALELWESDPRGIRRYNEVAGEFQQFQVLMQRFIENEPFQGPRVQNYVKNRCVLRNLLQVPVMRGQLEGAKKGQRKGPDNDTITSDMLVEIMEESIRIFWRFVRADKLESKGRKGLMWNSKTQKNHNFS